MQDETCIRTTTQDKDTRNTGGTHEASVSYTIFMRDTYARETA